jgi:hypothetical protein
LVPTHLLAAFFVARAGPKNMSYATVIAAIDAAIESWAGTAVRISIAGRSIEYRSLGELIEARKYYASLNATSTRGFQITNLKAGGPR